MVKLRKLSNIYAPQLEAVPLLLLFLVFFLLFSNYPALPETIPTHFNSQGLPDGWGHKNTLFIFLGMSIFIYALFTGITVLLAVAKNPRNLINLPAKTKERLSVTQVEILRVFLIRFLLALKILVLGLDACLLFGNIEVASNRAAGIGYWPFAFLAAIFILIGWMLFRIFRIAASAGG
jgi:uncharacterized membrane protein